MTTYPTAEQLGIEIPTLEQIRARIAEVTGGVDVELIGGPSPTIYGFVSLVPLGILGGYLLFKDEAGKLLATPHFLHGMEERYHGVLKGNKVA
jgi:hypothetical protein